MAETLEQLPDAELIALVRRGEVAPYGVLYQRHLAAAQRAAACLARTPTEREDLVAEAFTRVLRMLRDGRGPDEEFRPYLLVTLRNTAIHSNTRGAPVSLFAEVPDTFLPADDTDPVIDRWHAEAAADAFASLPERWRMVLWHTEIEEETPAEVAPLLGMRPNSVAALAYRAREGLRQAYLRLHVPEPRARECQATVNKLAGFVRHSIPLPLSRKIDRHLGRCSDCRARAETLTRVNTEIRVVVGPVVLGTSLAAAYLPAPLTSAASGALAVAADAAGMTGVLAAKTMALKAGAVIAIAAAAVGTTAAGPTVSSRGANDRVVGVVEGEGYASFTVDEVSANTPSASDLPPPASGTSASPPATTTPATPTVPAPAPTEESIADLVPDQAVADAWDSARDRGVGQGKRDPDEIAEDAVEKAKKERPGRDRPAEHPGRGHRDRAPGDGPPER